MTEPRTVWVGSIVVDCKNWERMVEFWRAALGYEFVRPPSGDWALLHDPEGTGPNLAFQKDPAGPGSTYWFHLDLYSSEPEAEVARLTRLGAVVTQPARTDTDYVTLTDPDGNPFDLVDARGYRFGQRTDEPAVPR
jgi:catechol 2,3-dioxygenase-like lactoylglutathione lyase family enzyme